MDEPFIKIKSTTQPPQMAPNFSTQATMQTIMMAPFPPHFIPAFPPAHWISTAIFAVTFVHNYDSVGLSAGAIHKLFPLTHSITDSKNAIQSQGNTSPNYESSSGWRRGEPDNDADLYS